MAIGFIFSSVLYLAPDLGTWVNLASGTEDFLKLSICHVWRTELALELYLHMGVINRNSELLKTNSLNFDYRMIDVKLFSGLQYR